MTLSVQCALHITYGIIMNNVDQHYIYLLRMKLVQYVIFHPIAN